MKCKIFRITWDKNEQNYFFLNIKNLIFIISQQVLLCKTVNPAISECIVMYHFLIKFY